MQLIIDTDSIKDLSTKDWLLQTLRLMNITYDTVEKRQTIEEYNNDIAESEKEFEKGHYITAEDLRKEARSW